MAVGEMLIPWGASPVLCRCRFASLSWPCFTGAFGMFGGPGFLGYSKVLGVYAMVEAGVLSGCS